MGIKQKMQLDKNENLYGPSEECYGVLKDVKKEDLIHYSRDEVLKKRLGEELGLREDRLVLGYGVEDILKEIFANWISRGERVLIPDRSWWYYDELVRMRGGVLMKYPVKECGFGYRTELEDILKYQRESGSKLILIGSPNNPTGHRIEVGGLEELLRGIGECIVCLDETYWGYGEDTTNELLRYVDRYDNLIVLRSFSKYYGLAGARIGYGFFGRRTRVRVKMYDKVLGFNRVSEKLALAAIDSRGYYERISGLIMEDREYLYRGLKGLMNVKVYKSEANFLLMRFEGGLLEELMKELGRMGIAVKVFGEKDFKDCIRVSVGKKEHNELMLRLIREKARDYEYSVRLVYKR